jgi:HAD superfamily hydrolase (TIGR01509 family)
MGITTILSDIAGVLLAKNPAWDDIKTWERRLNIPEGSLTQALYNPAMDRAALLGHISLDTVFQTASSTLGLHRDHLRQFEDTYWHQYQLNQTFATFLQSVRPHYTVALLSNAWPEARKAFNHLFSFETFVDFQLYSAEEGLIKPDPQFYALALDRLSVRPENVLFIDDRAENIAAAYTFGLHTHLFQESSQAIQAIRVLLHDHPLPDRTL